VPIFVDEAVLQRGAVVPEGQERSGDGQEMEKTGERIADEQLAVFKDIIDKLNLDDLGKGRH
ncbi:MAG: bifunctional nuclease family protein, partial [Actinobacteria bacterium]|nr:bifunctional nuclease family protein [Actinomycetota bacterium]